MNVRELKNKLDELDDDKTVLISTDAKLEDVVSLREEGSAAVIESR